MKDNPKKREFFDSLVKTFSPLAYVNAAGNDLALEPESSSSDDDGDFGIKDMGVSKKKRPREYEATRKPQEIDFRSVMATDHNKIDLLNHLTHTKVIAIKKAFNEFSGGRVDLDQVGVDEAQFVHLMRQILKDTKLFRRQNLENDLMDLYYRVNYKNERCIFFEDFTSYLIDHEIDIITGGTGPNNFYEVNSHDTASHNTIDKIYYFYQIDRIALFEQNMKILRLYDARNLKHLRDQQLPNVIVALEYIHEKNIIVIALSDRTLLFHDINSFKEIRKLQLPYSQRCLCYVRRKRCLFSGSISGIIFAWDLDKLFNNEQWEKYQKQKDKSDYSQFLTEGTPWFDKETILCLVDIPNLNLLASTSLNKYILLWDLRISYLAAADQKKQKLLDIQNQSREETKLQDYKEAKFKRGGTQKTGKAGKEEAKKNKMRAAILEEDVKQPYKILRGHEKAVRDLAYAEKQKILVSCGFDFEVIIWNPYREKPTMKLKGHEAPLVSVNCPHINPSIITCDNKGVVKVWDINDFSCTQTFMISNVNQVTCLRAVPEHRRLVAGSRSLKVYEYSKPFSAQLSDDCPILCSKYSSERLQFFICGEKTVKVWNARVGRPIRVLSNIVESDITAMELDGSHRKILVGDHNGTIKMFDVLSGVELYSFASHDREISFIKYSEKDKTVITGSWDLSVRIHRDTQDKNLDERKGVLRSIRRAHNKDIMCGDFSYNLNLIATGSRDQKVKIWNYETCKLEAELTSHKAEVTLITFIHPFPILISSDTSGTLNIWGLPPHKDAYRCIVTWKNMFTLQKTCPVTSISSYFAPVDKQLRIAIGDQMGMIRILDITEITDVRGIKPLNHPLHEDKRNPYRIDDLDASDTNMDHGDGMSDLETLDDHAVVPILEDLFVQQIAFWKGHNDAIKSLDFIMETDKPFVFSSGLDKMAKIWNLKGDLQGVFTQGLLTKVEKPWNFPLERYNKEFMKRKIAIMTVLESVKRKRFLEQEKEKLLGREEEKHDKTKMSFGMDEEDLQDFNAMEIDDEIGEILRNEEVFKDLKELDEIMEKNLLEDSTTDTASNWRF